MRSDIDTTDRLTRQRKISTSRKSNNSIRRPNPGNKSKNHGKRPLMYPGKNTVYDDRKIKLQRYRILIALTCILLIGICTELVREQLFASNTYQGKVNAEVASKVILPALRGAIYDRNGNVLSIASQAEDVYSDNFLFPGNAQMLQEAKELSPLLNESVDSLLGKFKKHSGYVLIAQNVNYNLEQKVTKIGLGNIYFIPTEVYNNPSGTLFQPLLGSINNSGNGDAGLQYLYNSTLVGHNGKATDAQLGPSLILPGSSKEISAPRDGGSLILSLDEPLQLKVTEALSKEMLLSHAKSAVAIFSDVKTGAILAMVDLVRTKDNKIEPAPSNLALTAVYEPGSVMKIATFSFALKDHIITPDTTLSVPYEIQIGGYTFQDAEYHPTQIMPAKEILAQSSNVGTIKIASMLGPNRFYQALKALGFGEYTGLNWPGESPGIIGSPSTWYGSDLGSLPIGLGEAVTPMQLLDAYNAVADGGVFRAPHIIDGIARGKHISYLPLQKGRRVLSTTTASTLTKMFEGVIQNGTGIAGCVPGYTVAGKTGTSQTPSKTSLGYIQGDWNATFIGFAPAQDPAISGMVLLHHPNPIYGGAVSAPVFSEVMRYALQHYGIKKPAGSNGAGQGLCSPEGALLARESGLALGQ